MTKQEFKEMTGIRVTDEQMWQMHEAYLASGLDKQQFCRMITNGNAVDLIKMLSGIGMNVICRNKDLEGKITQMQQRIKVLEMQAEEMKEFLLEQSREPDKDALRSKAMVLYGEREYYIALSENEDWTPDEEDVKRIAVLLKEGRK